MAVAGGRNLQREISCPHESQAKLNIVGAKTSRPSATQNSVERRELVEGPPSEGQLIENAQVLSTDDWAIASRPIWTDDSDLSPIRPYSNSLDTKVNRHQGQSLPFCSEQ